MKLPFFRAKPFSPDFPIVPLYAHEQEARNVLSQHGEVREEEPGSDSRICDKKLVAETDKTRISVGVMQGRVRFTNYLTAHFNENDERKGKKLGWFANYYGGANEFDEPKDTGHMIFWHNPKRMIMIVFGLSMGPVRIIDRDPSHWPDLNEK
jgi:hypothetical protein